MTSEIEEDFQPQNKKPKGFFSRISDFVSGVSRKNSSTDSVTELQNDAELGSWSYDFDSEEEDSVTSFVQPKNGKDGADKKPKGFFSRISGLWSSFSISGLFRRGSSGERAGLAQTSGAPQVRSEVESHSDLQQEKAGGLKKRAQKLGAKMRGNPQKRPNIEADIDAAGPDFPLRMSKVYLEHRKKIDSNETKTPTRG